MSFSRDGLGCGEERATSPWGCWRTTAEETCDLDDDDDDATGVESQASTI